MVVKIGYVLDYNSFRYRLGSKPEGPHSKIERCPTCGMKGLHFRYAKPAANGHLLGQWTHKKRFMGFAWEIFEWCAERENTI